MEIILYTVHCPACNVLETKLNNSGLPYTMVDDADEVIRVGQANHIQSAPILCVDGKYMKLGDANKWIKENGGNKN